MKNLTLRVFLPPVLLLVLMCSSTAFSQASFTAVKVPGVSPNSQISLNNSGEVLVNTASGSSYTLSIWSRLGGSHAVSVVGTNSGGVALNSSGNIAGTGYATSSSGQEGFLLDPGGTNWLPSLGGNLSAAEGINDANAVVGFSYTAADLQHAFLWTPSGGIEDLTPNVTSVGGAIATGINSSNEVVGYYYPNGSNRTLGFTWTSIGGLQNIGAARTLAYGVNKSGTVVGQSPNASGAQHAFSWTQAAGIKDLGTLGGGGSSALSINTPGWIVGTSLTTSASGLPHGFLWTASAGMRDLSSIGGLGANQNPYSMTVNDFGLIALSTNVGGYLLVPKMASSVISSANPSVLGQAVTFTATLTSIAGPPPDGELVQFVIGGKVVGSISLKAGARQLHHLDDDGGYPRRGCKIRWRRELSSREIHGPYAGGKPIGPADLDMGRCFSADPE